MFSQDALKPWCPASRIKSIPQEKTQMADHSLPRSLFPFGKMCATRHYVAIHKIADHSTLRFIQERRYFRPGFYATMCVGGTNIHAVVS